MTEMMIQPPTLWVDADACPIPVKDVLFRTSQRKQLALVVVANQSIRVPKSALIRCMTVRDGADVADHAIVSGMTAGDIVITGDIPLAARVVEQGGIAIGPRGEIHDDSSVHGRLATRNVMEQLRSAGIDTNGPRPLTSKDVQTFSNALDRTLTRRLRDPKFTAAP
jgi:uncharacterized protein YaiI (UPF0178 family)